MFFMDWLLNGKYLNNLTDNEAEMYFDGVEGNSLIYALLKPIKNAILENIWLVIVDQ